MKKFPLFAAALAASTILLSGCSRPADVASRNLTVDADNFEITRRVVFYNGITGNYILVIEGLCSIGNNDKPGKLTVTCKTGPNDMKHFLGLSDNVAFFAEQVAGWEVNTFHHRVMFRPQTVLPDIDFPFEGNVIYTGKPF